MPTILVVEDEFPLRESLVYNLEKQGFEVSAASDGTQALERARELDPALVILDINLPGIDGLEVTRILRQTSSTPILMLTAREDEIDRVIGLEIGADDYMTKPFSMRELLARVKALLRRVRLDQRPDDEPDQKELLQFNDLVINVSRHEILLGENLLSVRPKEYDLLLFFARNQGLVLTRDLLLDRVWGWDFSGNSRTVDVHVRWLRERIESDPARPKRIITVRGVGYRFDG